MLFESQQMQGELFVDQHSVASELLFSCLDLGGTLLVQFVQPQAFYDFLFLPSSTT